MSGGEGQRVRFARALARPNVRLALLDEPFRGLERPLRRALLRHAREHWRSATLVFVTHDLEETCDFDRVLVLDGGRLVEVGAPSALLAGDSRYRALVEGERELRATITSHLGFSRKVLEGGRLQDRPVEGA